MLAPRGGRDTNAHGAALGRLALGAHAGYTHRRICARRARPWADMLAPLSCVWGASVEEGLCQAPGHKPLWDHPVAASGRTVSARMRHPSCGALGWGTGVATAPAEQR